MRFFVLDTAAGAGGAGRVHRDLSPLEHANKLVRVPQAVSSCTHRVGHAVGHQPGVPAKNHASVGLNGRCAGFATVRGRSTAKGPPYTRQHGGQHLRIGLPRHDGLRAEGIDEHLFNALTLLLERLGYNYWDPCLYQVVERGTPCGIG